MLEISLSMVAAFAAYTFYAIVGDEIAANRSSNQVSYTPTIDVEKAKVAKSSTTSTSSPQTKTSTRKPKAKLIEETAITPDPITTTAEAILAYVSANGSVTINKLIKEIHAEKEIVVLAADKLIKDKSALSLKRGGHPAIGPIVS